MQDLREEGIKVHVLDKEFGVDTLAVLPSGQWLSIQEKYRRHKFLVNDRLQINPGEPDFTQETMNAFGTPHEMPGEWFKLGAQLYFYGWANEDETDFEKWVLIDIAKYKLLIESRGGIYNVGITKCNKQHGSAQFQAFPITAIKKAWLRTHHNREPLIVGTL